MSQAFTGSTIVADELQACAAGHRIEATPPVDFVGRVRFNPELNKSWLGAAIRVINSVTMLSIIRTGASLIREREHGTIEHLPVMPVTPFEIMTAKIWFMALVVLAACVVSLVVVVQGLLAVPVEGRSRCFSPGPQ